MIFEEEFFKNEVREGFFVSSMMKRAWAAQIEILEIFDKLCAENDIKYYAAYGTLLGAVRHKGFIPWDDDIDIWMIREDYEKLRTIAKNGELPDSFVLKTPYVDKDYIATFDRLLNFRGINFNVDSLEKYHGFPFCAGLDIFPLDYVPIGKKYDDFKEDLKNLIEIYSILVRDDKAKLSKRMRELLEIKYGYKINKKGNVINQIVRMIEKCIKEYCSNKSDRLGRVYGWGSKGFKESGLLKTEWFEKIEYIDFENYKIPAPYMYHETLESQYKNHMVAVRAFEDLHDYPFYKKQDAFFYETVNERITSFDYSKEDLAEYHSSNEYKNIKQSLLEKIEILNKINNLIIKLVEAGDYNKIMNFMADSQEIAIKIGGSLEESFNENINKEIISNLEKYCENLYKMSVGLSEDSDDFIESFKIVIQLVDEIKKQIEKIDEKERIKKIVFIFENQKDWDYYAQLYKKLMDEKEVKCYAVPIPYFLLDSHLKISENDLKFEGDKIESDIEFYDYASFEYESIDCIIKSNPYDNSSYADIIRPFFFSKNMHKYCKNLIHIPTLDVMDFTLKDVQMKEMADCFVKSPGVMYSDYVLLKSEVNTETYKSILNEVSEDVNWDNKVIYCPDDSAMEKMILDICKE